MQTRQQLMDNGKLYIVYPHSDNDNILFEGSRSKCKTYISSNCPTAYKKGEIRLGKLIWEKTD